MLGLREDGGGAVGQLWSTPSGGCPHHERGPDLTLLGTIPLFLPLRGHEYYSCTLESRGHLEGVLDRDLFGKLQNKPDKLGTLPFSVDTGSLSAGKGSPPYFILFF